MRGVCRLLSPAWALCAALVMAGSLIQPLAGEELKDAWRSRNDWRIHQAVLTAHQAGDLRLDVPHALSWRRSASRVLSALTWEQRLQLNEIAASVNVELLVDPEAPQLLAAARAAGEEAAAAFAAAQAAGALMTVDDHEQWGRALLSSGAADAARDRLLLIPAGERVQRGIDSLLRDLPAPKLRPKVVFHSLLGGPGDQQVEDITVNPEGLVVFSGQGFQAHLFLETLQMHVVGDPNTPQSSLKNGGGRLYKGWKKGAEAAQTIVDPQRDETYTWHTWQAHPILQQPYVASSAGWQLWGWSHSEAEPKSLMADSRLYRLWLRPDGLLGGLGWTDGGNTVFARHPQDLNRGGGMKGFGKGARIALFTIDPDQEGALVQHRVVGGTVPQHEADPWGNLWLSGTLSIHAGFAVIDEQLRTAGGAALGSSEVQGVRARCPVMVQHGRYLILGGHSNAPRIRGIKHYQDRSGGDADALMAVVEMW